MDIGVGGHNGKPHFAWRIGDEYRYAIGVSIKPGNWLEVSSAAAESFWKSRVGWKFVRLPVLNKRLALLEGVTDRYCWLAACRAFNRGNYYIPAITATGYAAYQFIDWLTGSNEES